MEETKNEMLKKAKKAVYNELIGYVAAALFIASVVVALFAVVAAVVAAALFIASVDIDIDAVVVAAVVAAALFIASVVAALFWDENNEQK